MSLSTAFQFLTALYHITSLQLAESSGAYNVKTLQGSCKTTGLVIKVNRSPITVTWRHQAVCHDSPDLISHQWYKLGFRQKSCEYLYDCVCIPGKETESLKRVVMQDISKYPVHTQLFWHGNGENKKSIKNDCVSYHFFVMLFNLEIIEIIGNMSRELWELKWISQTYWVNCFHTRTSER